MVKRGHCCTGPKDQKGKRSMDYFAGLDVSVKDTSVCVVDGTGKIAREVKVASEPAASLESACPTRWPPMKLAAVLACISISPERSFGRMAGARSKA